MKTTYAPKFPNVDDPSNMAASNPRGPLAYYYYLIAMRNAKVSIGAKLNYSK